MNLGWILVELQRKIDKIEDTDVDYQNNKKWQKYRKQQDNIYKEMRNENEMELK